MQVKIAEKQEVDIIFADNLVRSSVCADQSSSLLLTVVVHSPRRSAMMDSAGSEYCTSTSTRVATDNDDEHIL